MQDQHIYRKIIVKPLQKRFSTLTRVKFRRQVLIHNEKSASYKKCGFQTDKDQVSLLDSILESFDSSF